MNPAQDLHSNEIDQTNLEDHYFGEDVRIDDLINIRELRNVSTLIPSNKDSNAFDRKAHRVVKAIKNKRGRLEYDEIERNSEYSRELTYRTLGWLAMEGEIELREESVEMKDFDERTFIQDY